MERAEDRLLPDGRGEQRAVVAVLRPTLERSYGGDDQTLQRFDAGNIGRGLVGRASAMVDYIRTSGGDGTSDRRHLVTRTAGGGHS
jgi:hypothetical protein